MQILQFVQIVVQLFFASAVIFAGLVGLFNKSAAKRVEKKDVKITQKKEIDPVLKAYLDYFNELYNIRVSNKNKGVDDEHTKD